MTRNICSSTIIAMSVLLAGCEFQKKDSLLLPTAPSTVGSVSSTAVIAAVPEVAAVGTWTSPAIVGLPNIASCSNLEWQISNLSPATVSGNISALCGGIVEVTANVSGEMQASDVVNLAAVGKAVGLGITCPFSLSGVGHIQGSDAMRLDYQGTTCVGPVSGSEMLQRRTASAPDPAPAPAPPAEEEPAPEPGLDDGAFGCRSVSDHGKLVECIHEHIQPHDEYGAFEVTKRVAWVLRDEGAGLLIKTGGENIVPWRGYVFAAARICYPDGHIIKVISDVGPGGSNGPSWQDNGYVDRSLYVAAMDPR
jgi:hypothetical protein